MSETAREKLANFLLYRGEVHYPSDVVVLGEGFTQKLTYGDLRALAKEQHELRAHPSAAKLTREQFRTVIRYAQADLNKAVENYLHTLGIEVSD